MSETGRQAPLVGSIVAAAAILRLLAQDGSSGGVNAIARRSGISPSSCFNILKTLVSEGFVDFDQQTKTYSLGAMPVFLARRALNADQVLRIATPYLEKMAADYHCASSIWKIMPGNRLMLIGLFDSRAIMNIRIEVGQRLPSLVGAMGRCVAAVGAYDRQSLHEAFEKLVWQQKPSFEDYISHIELARKRGWATDIDNFAQGVTTIAAVITDRNHTPRYCISNILFSGQAETKRLDELGEVIGDVARQVSSTAYG